MLAGYPAAATTRSEGVRDRLVDFVGILASGRLRGGRVDDLLALGFGK